MSLILLLALTAITILYAFWFVEDERDHSSFRGVRHFK
jgi:hypothetical protein